MEEKQNTAARYPALVRSRWFLYLTGFFSGMSVMAIELGASRMLAPYFSSSQIVWTVIIGTIMIAMAIGNVWGGRAADRDPDPRRLYFRLLLAAIWCALIPFVGKYLLAGVTVVLALIVKKNFLIYASFLSCIVLFVFPLMLLGTVTPALMKFATKSLDSNGKIVGELEAVGTVGSILGTFLPTFVTIPTVGTAKTFLIFAAVLGAICLAFFISIGVWRVRVGVVSGAIILLLAIPFPFRFAFWEKNLLYEGESIYNYLQVKEDSGYVLLSTNVAFGVQSVGMQDGASLTGMYYDTAMAAPYMAENADDLLILGLGSGTYATLCRRYFPEMEITGVEIDEKIASLATKYFGMPKDVNAVVDDGRSYLSSSGKYDVIMVDAYQDITIPFQMSSVEFFREVAEHLSGGGVMVVNMNMRSESEDSINEYLLDTIAAVFPCVRVVVVEQSSNVEVFATLDEEAFDRYSERVAALDSAHPLAHSLRRTEAALTEREAGDRILTDDCAPVELLGMQVLDEMIIGELSAVRRALKEKGIKGFLADPTW